MASEQRKCARCGLSGGKLLDLGLGSVCHAEFRDCMVVLASYIRGLGNFTYTRDEPQSSYNTGFRDAIADAATAILRLQERREAPDGQ